MEHGWIDVQVQIDMDAGELAGLLNDRWMVGAWQEDGLIHLYWPHERWTTETHQELMTLMQRLVVPDATIAIHALPDEDWNAGWARSVRPLRVGERIVIRPSWESVAVNPGDVEIILDPKQAFGTGHHATTQLLLEWLETHIHGGERVLDVGTGSGILAMVALRLGATSAWGIDHDPVAIDCARAYAAENGFGPELTLDTSCLMNVSGEPFDRIVANLDRRMLLALSPALPHFLQSEGRLAVSGLLTHDRCDVLDAFRRTGVVLTWECERDGWLAMEFTLRHEAPICRCP